MTATARDAAGNTATSASVTVTVSNQGGGPDTIPPTVSISSPANNATVVGNVTVTANASDNVGVAGVQFKLDGNNLGAEVTASPWQVVWNTNAASNGSHTLTATASDAAGNSTPSAAVTVTVNNAAQILFGAQVVQPTLDSDSANRAEAFRAAASATGTAGHVTVYVDAGSASTQLIVGVYTDSGGHPATLLAQGSCPNMDRRRAISTRQMRICRLIGWPPREGRRDDHHLDVHDGGDAGNRLYA